MKYPNAIERLQQRIMSHNKSKQTDRIENRQRIRLDSRGWFRYEMVTLWPQGEYEGKKFIGNPDQPFVLCIAGQPREYETYTDSCGQRRSRYLPRDFAMAKQHSVALFDPQDSTMRILNHPNPTFCRYFARYIDVRPRWEKYNRYTPGQLVVSDHAGIHTLFRPGTKFGFKGGKLLVLEGEPPIIVQPTQESTRKLKADLKKVREAFTVAEQLRASYPNPREHPAFGWEALRNIYADNKNAFPIITNWLQQPSAEYDPQVFAALLYLGRPYSPDLHLSIHSLKRMLRTKYASTTL